MPGGKKETEIKGWRNWRPAGLPGDESGQPAPATRSASVRASESSLAAPHAAVAHKANGKASGRPASLAPQPRHEDYVRF